MSSILSKPLGGDALETIPSNMDRQGVPAWMHSHVLRRASPSLNANQQASIAAMIAYISSRSGQTEFRLERNLSDHFNVPNPKYLASIHFDEALRYLADFMAV